MSMPSWLNDAHPFQSNENGAFNPGSGDPSMFMQTPTTSSSSFDFSQMQNQQLQQRMPNGIARNGSPGYHNPMYQTQPLVPSKRPRPREDSIGASPQPNPGALPASQSQTPQGPYPGFQGAVNGNHQFTGTPSYQQYQQAGNNPGHSPVMQGQAYNPQAPHQRLQTMSPSPFSPATQTFGAQASPSQSEHGSRVNTPQNGVQQYAQGMPYGGAPVQPFTPPPGSAVNGTALAQYNQHLQNQQQQQRMNDARLRQMQQQRQHQAGALNSLAQPPGQMSAQQMAAIRAQQAQQRPNNPEQLLRAITQWNQQNGLPFSPNPLIAGRPISAVQLFIGVVRMGGSKKVTANQSWPNVAQFLLFPGPQCMAAGQDLQNYWHLNLSAYEQWFQSQQRQRQTTAEPMRASGHAQGGDAAARQGAFSPTKQMHNQIQQPMQPPSSVYQYQTPTKQITPQQHDTRQPLQNSYISQQDQARPSSMYNVPQPSMQAPPRAAPSQAVQKPSERHRGAERKKIDPWPKKSPIGDLYSPIVEQQGGKSVRSYGGIQVVPNSNFLGTVDDLLKYKASVPKYPELGVVDIRALSLSLRSGIHAEVRLALDTLACLSHEIRPLILNHCEDLLETLIDCADDQIQLLAEHSAEVSDAMLINSYEETVRGCKVENATLQDIPAFGTLEYDLDRAADRLICITTILRNFSFLAENHIALADPVVVRFLSTLIRYIGTRSMVLRTHQNLQDFSKDVVTFLTNVSQEIDLPGKEEAMCILHFLLSFAPSPTPNSAEEGEITFTSYIPVIHRYYPHAVDSLAKLLARGDPNRSFYRSIFAADVTSTPPYDLLTRAFGLAIAAMPEYMNKHLVGLLKIRAPYLAQGLLAAEILASLIPASEHELARSWLASQDGFAMNLLRIAADLGKQPPNPQQRDRQGNRIDNDPYGTATITERGFALLRKLNEKAKDVDGNGVGLPPGVLPDRRMVVQAMAQQNLPRGDYYVIRQLCALFSLDN
ncbi:hypothetical protein ABVK25_003436 [Lepraria finkii]|uniref:ARID domain-containing protein n=1 Tax=Lepraria finkii TaxID=1340010 RepID=A0ABR4BEY3_9LECA